MKRWLKLDEKDLPLYEERHNKVNKMLKGSYADKAIAETLLNNSYYMGACYKTYTILNFCTPYYEYIGIRTFTPEQVADKVSWGLNFSIFGQPFDEELKDDPKSGRIGSWPAIWEAVRKAELPGSCGNSHQYQINKLLVTGLYWNNKGKWFKKT